MSTPLFDGKGFTTSRLALFVLAAVTLSACDETGQAFLSGGATTGAAATETKAEAEFIEQDVESPEVFYALEAGLWDGRPSLGGVWVAYPDVKQPERVVIRNQTNGQYVIGALFRRERDLPGPRLQLSSDAAEAIGVLPGAPVELEVVAMRKEKIEVTPPEPEPAPEPGIETDGDVAVAAPVEVEAQSLDPIAAAEAAIEAAPDTGTAAAEDASVVAAATVGAAAAEETNGDTAASSLKKPYVQVAVFSVEKNAKQVDEQMRSIGLIPRIVETGSGDATKWRVLVGPAMSWNERRLLTKQIKAEGYSDAFAVAN